MVTVLVGAAVMVWTGTFVGTEVCNLVGAALGCFVGDAVGRSEGLCMGIVGLTVVGILTGAEVPTGLEATRVGLRVGWSVFDTKLAEELLSEEDLVCVTITVTIAPTVKPMATALPNKMFLFLRLIPMVRILAFL